jgi:hypothetical protein
MPVAIGGLALFSFRNVQLLLADCEKLPINPNYAYGHEMLAARTHVFSELLEDSMVDGVGVKVCVRAKTPYGLVNRLAVGHPSMTGNFRHPQGDSLDILGFLA